MNEKVCERCGASSPSPEAGQFALFSYCAECSQDLCDACMRKGCCGHVPARDGSDEDYDDADRDLAEGERT